MKTWNINEAVFYHIYPLGFCGSPKQNDFLSPPVERLNKLLDWLAHFKELGINAIYLGPLFESETHGYDTVNYYEVDRRLGTNQTLKNIIAEFHKNEIRVILDGVFNHSGRRFFAFQDIQKNRTGSPYTDWYNDLNFSGDSPFHDNFSYQGWAGCFNLVKFNVNNSNLREYIFNAVSMWIEEFHIDGLRLDAADVIDFPFLSDLSQLCKKKKDDFLLIGEVVHGDYRNWIQQGKLDSVTNYEAYKGLWSSFNEKNFFEIAYSLKRCFSEGSIYQNIPLYNFLDNHDVNRISDTLLKKEHLFPLYGLLFSIPGIPSIYYGSEFGIPGKRTYQTDEALRPNLDLIELKQHPFLPNLLKEIQQFISCRKSSAALQFGNYHELYVSSEQFIFSRNYQDETVIIAINSNEEDCFFNMKNFSILQDKGYDFLNKEEVDLKNLLLRGNWLRIIRL